MLKMIDCKECVWGSECHAHLAGIAACPVGERKPEAWELAEKAQDQPVATPEALRDYEWPRDQVEAFKAAYGR